MKAMEKAGNTSQLHSTSGCGITRKAVFVSVTEALSGNIPEVSPRTPLRDIARGFWFVNDSKIKQCELLVAVERGTVCGVWEIDTSYGWHRMTATAIPTRDLKHLVVDPRRKYCRVGEEVMSHLKGRKTSSMGIRMSGPVRYNF